MVKLSPGLFQPIAADDVAASVADVALAAPRNGIVEIAGPERAPFNEIVARYLKALGDPRAVVSDPEARYFGGRVEERSLVPLGEARLGRIGRRLIVTVPGGDLDIEWRTRDDHVLMTGPVEYEYEGRFDAALFGDTVC